MEKIKPGIAAVLPAPQPNTQIIANALANRKGGILKIQRRKSVLLRCGES